MHIIFISHIKIMHVFQCCTSPFLINSCCNNILPQTLRVCGSSGRPLARIILSRSRTTNGSYVASTSLRMAFVEAREREIDDGSSLSAPSARLVSRGGRKLGPYTHTGALSNEISKNSLLTLRRALACVVVVVLLSAHALFDACLPARLYGGGRGAYLRIKSSRERERVVRECIYIQLGRPLDYLLLLFVRVYRCERRGVCAAGDCGRGGMVNEKEEKCEIFVLERKLAAAAAELLMK